MLALLSPLGYSENQTNRIDVKHPSTVLGTLWTNSKNCFCSRYCSAPSRLLTWTPHPSLMAMMADAWGILAPHQYPSPAPGEAFLPRKYNSSSKWPTPMAGCTLAGVCGGGNFCSLLYGRRATSSLWLVTVNTYWHWPAPFFYLLSVAAFRPNSRWVMVPHSTRAHVVHKT